MKRTVLFILFLLQYITIYAQDQDFDKKITIGVYSNIGINQPIRLTRKYVTEDVGPFHGKSSWATGLKLSRMLTQKLRIEIVTGYTVHKVGFELSPPIYPVSKIYPETIRTFNIPINVHRYFINDFYLSLGTIADFEIPRKSYWIDSQNGIGFSIGAGKKFSLNNLVINISPDLELHSVIPFHSVDNQQRLLVFEIKLGLSQCFGKREKEDINPIISQN